ncbi:Crotonase, core domain protein [mine drainage metagenome]|uniref:Crotonase, core domain protein n=1 Tax=mine drainage metagenome TaxID=410659 RepID=T0YAS5_9ZZZZ
MTEEGPVGRKREKDGVELLVLRNPPVNALSTRLLAELGSTVAALEQDPTVRAVILTGDGPYFSAGADLKEMATMDLATAPDVVRAGHTLFARLAGLRAPVIAAINGLALAGDSNSRCRPTSASPGSRRNSALPRSTTDCCRPTAAPSASLASSGSRRRRS